MRLIDRRTLRDALLADVAQTVTYGKRLTGFRVAADRVTACFDDGAAVGRVRLSGGDV
ncbi:hypothetical protein [Nonomuraea sp. NPDC001699]